MDRHRSVTICFVLSVAAVSIALLHYDTTIHRAGGDALSRWERMERKWRWRLGWAQPGTPELNRLSERLTAGGLKEGAPVLVRIFKKESELEVWMKSGSRFVRFASYPICRWSGRLGPKLKEGDRQSPEGFYSVARRQLNPNSRWHRSFNLGYPNIFDQSHDRTGSFIMVHGGCSSTGCFAITNPVVDEIWHLINAAFDAGQKRFQVHVFPFRMTDWNLLLHGESRWADFWQNLKLGYNEFERTAVPPRVGLCNGRYTFRPGRLGSSGEMAIKKHCQPNLAQND